MTKFNETLGAAFVFLCSWCVIYSESLFSLDAKAKFHVLLSPLYVIISFGLISAAIVIYRTATFNDCPEAAAELRSQIKQAKEDLISKGFSFKLK